MEKFNFLIPIIIIIILVVEYIWYPRISYTRHGKYILFYGRKKRKFIILL